MHDIVIVNYNTANLTANSIASIERYDDFNSIRVFVVDNASGLNDYEVLCNRINIYDNVKLLSSSNNLGFGKGNNLVLDHFEGQYLVLLNSDTELTTNSISKAGTYLEENPTVGAVTCRLITPDGKLDHGCKRGFPTPKASLFYFLKVHKWLRKPELDLYRLGHLNEHEIHEVDAISGAFMVIRREVVEQVGLFDERFFMYGEDLDLCYRIKEAGWKIVYNPKLGDVIHYKGASWKKRKFKTLYNFYEAMFLFYNKYYLKQYNLLITVLVYLGISIQFVLKLIKNYCFASNRD